MARRIAVVVLAVVLVVVFDAVVSYGQTPDHLKCYKVHDPLLLSGTVDLDSPQFGVDPGCKIARGVPPLFCVPATKTVVAVRDRATGQPITPLPISGPDPGDRLCYKIKCDASPHDIEVTDQFGTRTLSGLRAKLLCTPAVKGGPSTCDPNECGLRGACQAGTCNLLRCACANATDGGFFCRQGGCDGSACTSDAQCPSGERCDPGDGCCPICPPGDCNSPFACATTTTTTTTTSTTTIACTACSGAGAACPGSGTPCTNDVNGFPCASGVCDVNGQCCASTVFDVNGHCCDSAKCDVNGQCCASGAFDVNGHCCDSGLCNVNGQCCP